MRVGGVAVAVAWTWAVAWAPVAGVDLIGAVATVVGGYPIFRKAFEAIAARRMTMELSMTIAIIAALVIGEIFTALVIVLFVLVAEIFEHLTIERGRGANRGSARPASTVGDAPPSGRRRGDRTSTASASTTSSS